MKEKEAFQQIGLSEEFGLFEEFMKVFQNPGKEYRGTPFWSWNTRLESGILEEQIEQFREMGMGGFYIHTRVGLDTEYLGTEYMECVKKSVQIAKEKGLFCCLYDEDRWPSGYGGGRVTVHQKYRSRNILITPYKKGTKDYGERKADSMASASPQGNGTFLAAYYVSLNPDGTLSGYERCTECAPERAGYTIWYVYLEIAHDSPWFNNQSYVDSLNPEAVRYFIEVTHEKYREAVGEEFGKTIPSVFTDEPQFGRKQFLGTAQSKTDVMLPFTDDFPETYQAAYGEEFLASVPELLWELQDGEVSVHRYRYHDHVTERFAQAFCGQVGKWCEGHQLALAGHMMEEPTLQSQTQSLGEVMRCLSSFWLPGREMRCDNREYTTAKQAERIWPQYGRAGVVSELYGVTNWDFDFRGHKLQGDWQAALGITHRGHHLNWMSMNGEAKRDYPAAIGFQSPWYREYGLIEDHFARVNTAMRRGTPHVRIGVIHPIESYWLLFGPNRETGLKRKKADRRFQKVTEWLLFHTLDFDYICESILPGQWDGDKIGRMHYDAVVIPGCLTLRNTTLDILEEMKQGGAKLIFMGNPPQYADAVVDKRAAQLARTCSQIEFEETELLNELEEFREIDIRFCGEKHLKKPNHKKNWDGERTEKYLYQMREEGKNRWLFIANGRAEQNPDLTLSDDVKIELSGNWRITELDTMDGSKRSVQTLRAEGKTTFYYTFFEHDSLLLYMEAIEAAAYDGRIENQSRQRRDSEKGEKKQDLFCQQVQITREEDNVLVLDLPQYRFGENYGSASSNGFSGPEEILRIDNQLRDRLKLPQRRAALAQPWTQRTEDEPYPILLKYQIRCKDMIENAALALENPEAVNIYLDGQKIEKEEKGDYVDPCIHKIRLPKLTAGNHDLILEVLFTRKVNLEACYLLGNFAVQVVGSRTFLTHERKEFGWGSVTEQGMPFYGGNVIYSTECDLNAGTYIMEVSRYRAPLLKVSVDGQEIGSIIKAPYRLSFQISENGAHRIDITSFGNRVNTFGALHDCDERECYFDPNAWRTTDESWSYEYRLKQTGILKAPVIWRKENESN